MSLYVKMFFLYHITYTSENFLNETVGKIYIYLSHYLIFILHEIKFYQREHSEECLYCLNVFVFWDCYS